MDTRVPRRGALIALLALILLSSCGRLEIVSLTQDPNPCDYYTTAVSRFDLIANGINNRLDDPVAAVLRFEDAARESYELLPDGTTLPDSAFVIYGDYLLALNPAREGNVELTRQYAINFIQMTASVQSNEQGCGA